MSIRAVVKFEGESYPCTIVGRERGGKLPIKVMGGKKIMVYRGTLRGTPFLARKIGKDFLPDSEGIGGSM